jgi:Uma2 family endonuclease
MRRSVTSVSGQPSCYALGVTQLARSVFTFSEYVDLEVDSRIKHEFLDGVVYARAGASPEHAAVTANVVGLLRSGLQGKRCRVFSSDLRIRVEKTGLGTYPDASVICDRVALDPGDPKGHTALNPTLLAEVLSPSTEDYDRGEKLSHYKRIESLREVMLVAHDEQRVDLWRRSGRGWTQLTFHADQSVILESAGCSLSLSEIYSDPLAS